jgi:hypothetical protein
MQGYRRKGYLVFFKAEFSERIRKHVNQNQTSKYPDKFPSTGPEKQKSS